MAHQTLYRAYRPTAFKEVIGQEPITDTLAEAVKEGAIGHAYLFAGSRGLGKTSVARIFARAIGCKERDLHEIDAASHNGVDHIRELSDNVYTLPFESPYKVYILDEVHMLSKGAWNAFLKTLEEPPQHAVFILATTELARVPETVQSRCQVFQFRKPGKAALAKLVSTVAKKEGYDIEPGAADLIALLADGSYRDSLSVLERVLAAASDKKVTRKGTEEATGAPRGELVEKLVSALSAGKTEDALVAIRSASDSGVDMSLYLSLVIDCLRAVLLVRHAPGLRKEIEAEEGSDAYKEIEKMATDPASKLTHEMLKAFLDASSKMRFASVPSLPLEIAVYELFA